MGGLTCQGLWTQGRPWCCRFQVAYCFSFQIGQRAGPSFPLIPPVLSPVVGRGQGLGALCCVSFLNLCSLSGTSSQAEILSVCRGQSSPGSSPYNRHFSSSYRFWSPGNTGPLAGYGGEWAKLWSRRLLMPVSCWGDGLVEGPLGICALTFPRFCKWH